MSSALLAYDDDNLVGYGNVERFADIEGQRLAAELVVHPEHRGHGFGSKMLEEALRLARSYGVARMDVWAYRGRPGSAELARRFGFSVSRELFEIGMPLPDTLPSVALPEGIELRGFRPGKDDAEWLALNNLVFAGHPEQGNWDIADLAARLDQGWFKAEDFLVAVELGKLVAYNWLKLDEEARDGEIYVIGVHPSLRGIHFGRSLTILGLQHMKERGMIEASAFVDAENKGALSLYQSLGFTVRHTDLLYSKLLKGEPSA